MLGDCVWVLLLIRQSNLLKRVLSPRRRGPKESDWHSAERSSPFSAQAGTQVSCNSSMKICEDDILKQVQHLVASGFQTNFIAGAHVSTTKNTSRETVSSPHHS